MKQILKTTLFLAVLFTLVYSCKKESDDSSVTPPPTSSGTMTATISGRAIDESNNAVSNASVVIGGQTTTTDQYGIFLLKDVSVNARCIATITKTGFFNCTNAFIPKANTVNYIKVVLMSNAQTHTLSASAGGTVTLAGGSSIQFAPNSFVVASSGSSYSGTVSLSVKHLSPDAPNFGFTIPGGDLLGKNSTGNDVALYTFGMLGAELKGSGGELLQLATGATATLTMSIAASQTATAPSSIPLWYFDEATSLWKEEGSANRVGNNYVGTVSHFTWWNCDYQGPRATITGKVMDCDGTPLPNIVVTIDGSVNTITNQLGVYTHWVPAGFSLTVQVLAIYNNNLFLNSQLENIPALAVSQTFIVPDLLVACPARIAGTLKTCAGVNVDGHVFASWSPGGFNYQYTPNGDFSLACLASSTIDLDATASYNSSYFTFSGQYLSPAIGNTTNIGDLLLCSQVLPSVNNLTINGGPFTNQQFMVDTNFTLANYFSGAAYKIDVRGSAIGYPVCNFALLVNSLSPATFPWSSATFWTFSADIITGTTHYMVEAYPSSGGSTTITYSGNRVIGSFSGNATLIEDSAFSYPVTISGNFDVTH